jgi:hypothetical protein
MCINGWLRTPVLFVSLLAFTHCSSDRQLNSIDVIPSNESLTSDAQTVQYKAVGHFNRSPVTEDITSQVIWTSSSSFVAVIDSSGLATGGGNGTTTILASSTAGRHGAEITGVATLTVGATLPLSVTFGGNGTGKVTSTPPGITCPSACGALFAPGTSVNLIATADPGSTFAGWTGCEAPTTTNVCTVVMNDARIVTATFNSP